LEAHDLDNECENHEQDQLQQDRNSLDELMEQIQKLRATTSFPGGSMVETAGSIRTSIMMNARHTYELAAQTDSEKFLQIGDQPFAFEHDFRIDPIQSVQVIAVLRSKPEDILA
tara:strand:- start:196 stop:537 length:342 start_codon:yes stop_codon:yes gene_type:complete